MGNFNNNLIVLVYWINDVVNDKWDWETYIAGTDADRKVMEQAFAEYLTATGRYGTVYDYGWTDRNISIPEPVPEYKLAVDISNWGGVPNNSTLKFWKESGVKKVIVGCDKPEITQKQLLVLSQYHFGFELEAYKYIYADESYVSQLMKAVTATEGYNIKRLYLDVEGIIPLNKEQFLSVFNLARVYFSSIGVYTSAAAWKKLMDNITWFSDCPLWYAHYDNVRDFSDFQPFGGWEKPTIKQFKDNVNLGGITVDLNVYVD